MTIAEQLRSEGVNKPDFTKDEFITTVANDIRRRGSASFIIGNHVGTRLDDSGCSKTIGTCNPYNREFALKFLAEEGFKYEFTCNCYGVERLHVRV